ncbi:MAG: PD-(D/E)XK nuclease family protein [Leptolyngbyaceae cyanobacterium]
MTPRQISQSHLTLLEYCPRKFQYVYLEQLGSPPSPDEQRYLDRGSQIHHLMQQQELSLPLPDSDHLPEFWPVDTVQLYQTANALATAVQAIDENTRFRQSEYRLHYEFEGVLLTVVYDLLLLNNDHARIFDWKTYSQPPSKAALAEQWQTKLYPFVLAETSEYAPADISLSYWFIQPANNESQTPDVELQPTSIQFDYGDRIHERIRQSLTQILGKLKQWLKDYDTGTALPQTERVQEQCTSCPFALRCDRYSLTNEATTSHPSERVSLTDLVNIEAIEEVPLPSGTTVNRVPPDSAP